MTIHETLEQDITPPIVVHESPLPDQLWALLRQLLPPLTVWLVARGYVRDDTMAVLAVLAGAAVPLVVGQLKTRLRAVQLATVEKATPDSILTTKAKAK